MIKLCKDCKYCEPFSGEYKWEFSKCSKVKDLVSGATQHYCSIMRRRNATESFFGFINIDKTICGKEGFWFEEKMK